MTELARRLLAYLQENCQGAERAHSRALLAAVVGCGDRALRRAIAELREEGYPIVGDPRTGGYYLAASRAEADVARAILLSYIRSLCRQTRALERQFDLGQTRLPLEVEA